MGLGERLKALRDKLGQRAEKPARDETDSSAAPIVNNPPDPISGSVADLDAAGFPPELR